MILDLDTTTLSGYSQSKTVLAQRYRMGKSKWVYLISLPLHLIPSHLPIPDPEKPFAGNRRVNRRHAEGFAHYWRERQGDWATPPLMLDTLYPLGANFDTQATAGGVEFGILALPHNSAAELDILDGQHRILGWSIAIQDLTEELKEARNHLANSREAENDEGIAIYEKKVDDLTLQQERLGNEYVTLTVLEGVTAEQHRQVFADIANNAKGITKSVTINFDQRGVINRAVVDLAENNQLLAGRVDSEKDRVLGSNPNFVSARNVSDIVRHLMVGIDGRMTRSREATFKESAVLDIAEAFFDDMVESFPLMNSMAEEVIDPQELRNKSMLGSSTMLRVLAGTYHNLAVDISDERHAHVTVAGRTTAKALFKSLAPHMGFPVSTLWLNTGHFPDQESKAPSSRSQDLKGLTNVLTTWGHNGKLG